MKTTYQITYLLGMIDNSICPSPIISKIFPAYDGSQTVISDQSKILVTFSSPQTPVDLGVFVKVEEVETSSK